MTTTITSEPDETAAVVGRDGKSWHRLVVPAIAVVVVVAIVGAGAGWWFLGGAHLHGYAPDGGAVTIVGTPRNFGIELETSGGEARLASAKVVSVSAGMTVAFVASDLKGSEDGHLAVNGIDARPLRGTRARGHGPGEATFMTVAVTAQHEGVFYLHDFEITYKAGLRTRRVRVRMDQCMLALDAADRARALPEIDHALAGANPVPPNDPLVAEYVNCIR